MTGLKKVVNFRTVVSTGAGLALATATYTTGIQVASYVAGESAWIAILVAGLISVLASFGFSELVGMYPTAAGIKLFIERAFNEKVALVFASIYVLVTVAVVGTETYILGNVLASGLPAVPKYVWVVSFLLLITLINIRGVRLAGLAQDIVTYFMFAALIAISVYALAAGGFALRSPLSPGDGIGFLQAVALGIFLYLGFEWVTPLAEEVTDFKLIPGGMLGAIGLLGVTYSLFNMALTVTVPKEILIQSPIPHVLFARELFGWPGVMFMMLMSVTASVTSFNAGLLTASRFMYALSRDRALPRFLSLIHPRYATPWTAVVTLFALSLAVSTAVYISGLYKVFIFLGAAVESMIFVIMSLSVVALRRRDPGKPRPFRVPFGVVIPVVVAMVYGALFFLVFFPDPGHLEDWATQKAAAIVLASTAIIVAGYVIYVVPWIRARYAAKQVKRRRTPGTQV